MHACIHTHTHTCMHACIRTYIHTYIHTYTHTHTHTHLQAGSLEAYRGTVGPLPHTGLGFRYHTYGLRIQVTHIRVQGLGFRVQGLGFRVQGLGFRVQGLGFENRIEKIVQKAPALALCEKQTVKKKAHTRDKSTCDSASTNNKKKSEINFGKKNPHS